jgi:hypothetical protein
MDHRSFLTGLRYRGRIESVKRVYHVLEGSRGYVLISPRRGESGGNYSIVPTASLNYLLKRLGGRKSISTGDALAECKRSQHFPDRFSVLNAVYVLIALGKARISKRQGQKLFFGISKTAL